MSKEIVIAVPKGRILKEFLPVFEKVGIEPEIDFFDEESRKLSFNAAGNIRLIRVRSFDVATFVGNGAAHLGIAGSDVLMEFDNDDIYQPVDLKIGKCRLSLAAPAEVADDGKFWAGSHIRIATKYVNITREFFAKKGIQAECIKLNGAIELAPSLGLADRIVDLVSSGGTLKANGLKEVEVIAEISSRLIVHKGSYKTRSSEISGLIDAFTKAAGA